MVKIPDEAFYESDGRGRIDGSGTTRYRYDDTSVEITEWPGIEFAALADVARALKKRHPGKTILIPPFTGGEQYRDFDANEEEFSRLIREALRVLGVSPEDIEGIKVYEGSPGGDYRKTLRNAAFYGERYLVGKSLMQHHDPYREVGSNWNMDDLAEELVDTTRAVIFSTRGYLDRPAAMRLAVQGLREAVESARSVAGSSE